MYIAAIVLLGGDKTGNNRWYKVNVPIADRLTMSTWKSRNGKGGCNHGKTLQYVTGEDRRRPAPKRRNRPSNFCGKCRSGFPQLFAHSGNQSFPRPLLLPACDAIPARSLTSLASASWSCTTLVPATWTEFPTMNAIPPT